MSFQDMVTAMDVATRQLLGDNVAVTYVSEALASGSVTGIFELNHAFIDEAQPGIDVRGPAVFLVVAELPADPMEDKPTITIVSDVIGGNGQAYSVKSRSPDGHGGILLGLRKVL